MKKTLTNAEELTRAIAELELKAAAQKRDIQETFAEVSESLKPVNLVKMVSVMFFQESIKKNW